MARMAKPHTVTDDVYSNYKLNRNQMHRPIPTIMHKHDSQSSVNYLHGILDRNFDVHDEKISEGVGSYLCFLIFYKYFP